MYGPLCLYHKPSVTIINTKVHCTRKRTERVGKKHNISFNELWNLANSSSCIHTGKGATQTKSKNENRSPEGGAKEQEPRRHRVKKKNQESKQGCTLVKSIIRRPEAGYPGVSTNQLIAAEIADLQQPIYLPEKTKRHRKRGTSSYL